jgi:hypothetical protein
MDRAAAAAAADVAAEMKVVEGAVLATVAAEVAGHMDCENEDGMLYPPNPCEASAPASKHHYVTTPPPLVRASRCAH